MEVKIDFTGGDDLPGLPLVLAIVVACILYSIKHKRRLDFMQFCSLRNMEEEPERFREQNYDPLWQNDKKYNLG